MSKIRFVANDKSEQQFTAALRRNVNNYFKENNISNKANLEMKVKTAIMLALYIVPFVAVLSFHFNPFVALLLVVIMGIGLAGVGMSVMHDAAHGSYSSKEWVNRLFASTMYILGSDVYNWKIQHNVLHHTYTNIDGLDHDIESKGPIRLSDNSPLKWIHKHQYIHAFFFYGLMTLTKLLNDFVLQIRYHKAGLTKKSKISPFWAYTRMILIKVTYALVVIMLPIWIGNYSIGQVILGFVIMHWVAGFILSTVFQLAHVVEGATQPMPDKDGIIANDWTVHELMTTANFARNNRLLNWYIGGLNFQIEHHLFPYICHVHYPKISPIVEQTAIEFGYPYNKKPTLADALVSHVRRLKELGRPSVTH